MKKLIATPLLLAFGMMAAAQIKTPVTTFNLAGPYAVAAPFAADTVDVKGRQFDPTALLGAVPLTSQPSGTFSGAVLPSLADSRSVGVLTFYVNNSDYLKGRIEVKGPKHYKLYIDGVEAGADLRLAPEHHTFAIQYLAEPADSDSIQVSFNTPKSVPCTLDKRHPYMVHDLTDGQRVRDIRISADGQYAVVTYQTTTSDGQSRWRYELREVKTRKLLSASTAAFGTWMPRSVAFLAEERQGGSRMLYKVDPRTGSRTLFASQVPEGAYTVAPTEDYLILTLEDEGPKEDPDVFEVVEMDDRQPGWRKRTYLAKFDVKTGLTQRLTFGSKGESLYDISQDGTRLLVGSFHNRLAKRPTAVMDVYLMDAATLHTDTLLVGGEFIEGGYLSPDGRQVLFRGHPEAFGRIGCQLPAGVTPSMTENELFLFDIATRQVTPLTKDFDPSVNDFSWSWADGQIYFSAEDRDYVNLFVLNPKSGRISQLPIQGDYAYRFDLAAHAPVLGYLSYKTMEPASAYVWHLKSGKQSTFFHGAEALGDAEVGTCQDWNFQNAKGDTVYGRLYLPKDFDATKQYPLIVYYYGGCAPVSRYFESPYAPQYWNSLGYVAYIVEPSGATGFGQEWASRHVNTAGRGPAEDIIEGVQQLCATHPYINKAKIGCMGASYGGFMTQYLQTQTDLFAAAVSHAGIANHTSYWGEGYWGYSYSQVSMANSYPWSHRQLYVDQSPLFNADKIHTPLLLLHGDADTNVPLIESLQMFTALKLLGREVALVEVKGENHHILDYHKKSKWLATQMAWFQKWLKDDPTWWDALYPKKHL